MPAAQYDFIVEQGAEFDRTLTWKDLDGNLIDLTGFTAVLQGRFKKDTPATLFEMSTANGAIILGGVAATIQLIQTAAQTRLFTFIAAVYDLELTSSGGKVTRLFEGLFKNSLEVTR